ncbi:MAG: hypothetical protein ABR980_11180 [Ignavibacteriaceae bacterium]|jgi:hypothetical protein
MKGKILLLLSISLTIVSISLAQYTPVYPPLPTDTVFIPGGSMAGAENEGSMEATINKDLNIDGTRVNPNRVYALFEGEVYYQLAPIIFNNPNPTSPDTLIIVGTSDPDPNYTSTTGLIQGTTKPLIRIKPTLGVDVHVNGYNGVNEVYGSIKMVNIQYKTMQLDGTIQNELFLCGTANQLPQSLTIHNCLFEFCNTDLFDCTDEYDAIGGWPYGAKFRITNSYFRNMFNIGKWFGGRIIDCREPIDTLWVENCTVTTGSLTFCSQKALTVFAYFNHNTFVNNVRYWLLSPFYIKLIVSHNIFMNQNWVGEDTNVTNTSQDPDNEFMSTINIDTTDAYHAVVVQPQYYNSITNTYSSAVSLSNMKVFVSDNVNFDDP